MFEQTLSFVQKISRAIAGFDMSNNEYKDFCSAAWKDGENKNLCTDRS